MALVSNPDKQYGYHNMVCIYGTYGIDGIQLMKICVTCIIVKREKTILFKFRFEYRLYLQ